MTSGDVRRRSRGRSTAVLTFPTVLVRHPDFHTVVDSLLHSEVHINTRTGRNTSFLLLFASRFSSPSVFLACHRITKTSPRQPASLVTFCLFLFLCHRPHPFTDSDHFRSWTSSTSPLLLGAANRFPSYCSFCPFNHSPFSSLCFCL